MVERLPSAVIHALTVFYVPLLPKPQDEGVAAIIRFIWIRSQTTLILFIALTAQILRARSCVAHRLADEQLLFTHQLASAS